MRLDLLGLQAFLAIAERGSFHAAAAHLNLSQTALSHRIRKFEELIGLRLLARTTRQVSLTPAGVELLPKARKLVEEMTAAFEGLRGQARQAGEKVTIGCLPTIAMFCLPKVLARFGAAHPETSVRVFDSSATEIAERVQRGEVAFGITVIGANRWDLDTRPLAREPFVLLVARDLPLAARPAIAWSELAGIPLVRIAAETGNRILIDDALGEKRDTLAWRYEVQRITTAVSLVQAGICGAIVPQLAVDVAGDARLVAVPLTDPGVLRTLAVITRRGVPLEAGAAILLTLIEQDLARTLAGRG